MYILRQKGIKIKKNHTGKNIIKNKRAQRALERSPETEDF